MIFNPTCEDVSPATSLMAPHISEKESWLVSEDSEPKGSHLEIIGEFLSVLLRPLHALFQLHPA